MPALTLEYTLALPAQAGLAPHATISLPIDSLQDLSAALLSLQAQTNAVLTQWKEQAGADEVVKEREAEKAHAEARKQLSQANAGEESASSDEEEDDRDEAS
jgi:hypothetical protein